jgi:D-sedoheptulose 7-phosphate isomerase
VKKITSTKIDIKLEEIAEHISESIRVKEDLINKQTLSLIAEIVGRIIECYQRGGKVILFGNGGSAADAQHLACEFLGKFQIERKALKAISLNTNTSVLTAVGNDYDFEATFARQVGAWAEPEDVVIALSTSGSSPNILRAVEKAKEKGTFTVGLTGLGGTKLAKRTDICIKVPCTSTPRIQEAHITIGHIICYLVEKALFEG